VVYEVQGDYANGTYDVLTEIKRDSLKEFQKPKLEFQYIMKIKDIKKQLGEIVWSYNQWFKIYLDRVTFQI